MGDSIMLVDSIKKEESDSQDHFRLMDTQSELNFLENDIKSEFPCTANEALEKLILTTELLENRNRLIKKEYIIGEDEKADCTAIKEELLTIKEEVQNHDGDM